MTNLTFKEITEIINDYDLLLFDLWGVIIEDGNTYPGVVEAVNKILTLKNILFLSNAPRPNFAVAQNLQNWGLSNVTSENVLTSGDIARTLINEHQSNNSAPVIYHLGDDRNNDILQDVSHQLTDNIDDAEILLLSLHRDDDEDVTEFNDVLQKAAKNPNIKILCSNPDITVPRYDRFRYCAGYFASIVEKFGGNVIYTGKPKKIIYDEVLRRHNTIDPNRILMVGDTFETDILGANNAGIHSALVMTGNAKNFHRMYESMNDKLRALSERSRAINAKPNFVTKIF